MYASLGLNEVKTLFQEMFVETLIWPGVAVALVCQLMTSPIETCDQPPGWTWLPLERRLSDAKLVVYAKAVDIQYKYYTVANTTRYL